MTAHLEPYVPPPASVTAPMRPLATTNGAASSSISPPHQTTSSIFDTADSHLLSASPMNPHRAYLSQSVDMPECPVPPSGTAVGGHRNSTGDASATAMMMGGQQQLQQTFASILKQRASSTHQQSSPVQLRAAQAGQTTGGMACPKAPGAGFQGGMVPMSQSVRIFTAKISVLQIPAGTVVLDTVGLCCRAWWRRSAAVEPCAHDQPEQSVGRRVRDGVVV